MGRKKGEKPPKFVHGKYTKASSELSTKYCKEHYDDIKLRVPKGERQRYSEYAKRCQMSLNRFFIQAADKYIEERIK